MKQFLLERNQMVFEKTQDAQKHNLIHTIISSSKWPNNTPVETILSILIDLEFTEEEIEFLYTSIIQSN